MKLEQLSIFLENRSGRLAEITGVLARAGINIRALSLADTADFGILRLIVTQTGRAVQILRDSGFTVATNEMVALDAGRCLTSLSLRSPAAGPLPAGSHIRRRHVRLPLDLPVTYQRSGGAEERGQVNLSDGGLLLEAPEILPLATPAAPAPHPPGGAGLQGGCGVE